MPPEHGVVKTGSMIVLRRRKSIAHQFVRHGLPSLPLKPQ
jgi:hypothetical protein